MDRIKQHNLELISEQQAFLELKKEMAALRQAIQTIAVTNPIKNDFHHSVASILFADFLLT